MKFAAIGLATVALIVALAGPSSAGGTSGNDGNPDSTQPASGGRTGGVAFAGYNTKIKFSNSGAPGGDTSSGPRHVCTLHSAEAEWSLDPADGLVAGEIYAIHCTLASDPDGPLLLGTPDLVVYDPGDPTEGTIVTSDQVRSAVQRARRLDLPGPQIATSPPADNLVVGFETWFATVDETNPTNPELPTATPVKATAGAYWAIARATASTIELDMGDGQPGSIFTCDTAQAPFDPARPVDDQRPDCARYAYQFSSNNTENPGGTYTIVATVTYDVFIETESQPPTFFETLTSAPTTLEVTVTARQAVIR